MRTIRLAFLGITAATLALMLVAPSASAHERRLVVDGQYQLIVGFLDEPAYAGEKNGLDLRIARIDPAATPVAEGDEIPTTPVEGLETTLQAEVFYADQTMPLVIEASYGQPGSYESVFFPTQPGDYSFRIFGTIEGIAIDETFTSGPDTFSPMGDPAPLQFPQEAAASAESAVTTASASSTFAGLDAFGGSQIIIASGIAAIAGLYAVTRRFNVRRSLEQ